MVQGNMLSHFTGSYACVGRIAAQIAGAMTGAMIAAMTVVTTGD